MENGERKNKVIVYKRKEVNRDFLPLPPRQEMVENYSSHLEVEEKKSNKVEWREKG